MNAMDTRTARHMMVGLVAAGAVMAAVGATNFDPRAATVLPSIGAALVAAGVVLLIHAETLSERQELVIGAALLAAGVVMTVIGSVSAQVAVSIAVVPLGGALAAAGVLALVSGAVAVGSKGGLSAR